MSIVDFPNMDYDKGMAILKQVGYPDEDAELLAHQFAGDFEDDFGAELKTAVKESFLVALKHPGHSDQSIHNPKKGGGIREAIKREIKFSKTDESKLRREAAGHGLTAGPAMLAGLGIGALGGPAGIAAGIGLGGYGAYRLYRGIKAERQANELRKTRLNKENEEWMKNQSNKEMTLKHPGHFDQSIHDPKHRKGASPKPSKSGGLSALPNKIADKWNALTPEQKATVIRSAVGIALTVGGVLASPGVARGIGGAATGIARGVGAAAHGANRAAGASMYRGIINRGHKRWAKQNRGGSLSDFLNTPAGRNLATEAGSRYLIS